MAAILVVFVWTKLKSPDPCTSHVLNILSDWPPGMKPDSDVITESTAYLYSVSIDDFI